MRHKPFGVQIRMIKCIKCGKWGHQAGDRECTGGVLESIKHMDEMQPQDNKQIGESIPSLTAAAAREMSKKWVLKSEVIQRMGLQLKNSQWTMATLPLAESSLSGYFLEERAFSLVNLSRHFLKSIN